MKKLTLPSYVNELISRLEKGGFEGFIVGGCVRDALSGKLPHDYDMTTSATPDEMAEAFSGLKTIPTGIKHGTLTVICDGCGVEVTTYRRDGEYLDNRHPKSVSFTKSIEDDLSRRDFTVNAMAYSERTGVIDLFGGMDDLKHRIIRCVGTPDKRFLEDGLRVMRGLRFASTLGFDIEAATSKSMITNRELLLNIAPERLWSEFCRLICGCDASKILRSHADVIGIFIPEILPMIGFDQKTKHHCFDVYEHTLRVLDECPESDLALRLSAYFHDIGKPHTLTLDANGGHFYGHAEKSAEITEAIFRRLHSDNAVREATVKLISEHCRQLEPNEKAVKRFLLTHDDDEMRRYIALYRADRLACAPDNRDTTVIDKIAEINRQLVEDGKKLILRDLAVNGYDLAELGYFGRDIGKALQCLLDAVIDGDIENSKQELINYLKNNNI